MKKLTKGSFTIVIPQGQCSVLALENSHILKLLFEQPKS